MLADGIRKSKSAQTHRFEILRISIPRCLVFKSLDYSKMIVINLKNWKVLH